MKEKAFETGFLEIFGIDDIEGNIKLKNDDNLDLPNTQSSVYGVEITRMR